MVGSRRVVIGRFKIGNPGLGDGGSCGEKSNSEVFVDLFSNLNNSCILFSAGEYRTLLSLTFPELNATSICYTADILGNQAARRWGRRLESTEEAATRSTKKY